MATTIQKLVNLIEKSMLDLGAKSSQDFIESAAILIHESMSGPNRRFHTADHIFQVVDPKGDPVLVLAALFHDLVYYNVDGTLTAKIDELLRPYIAVELEQVFIRRRPPSQDLVLPVVLNIFGFSYGQLLTPYTGLNEFLSALVFARLFQPILNTKDWIAVIACLEASQPFRKENEEGKTCFVLLEERLGKLNRTRDLGFSENQIIEFVRSALRFANLDVGNFSYKDSVVFLDNTWKLLPENNPHLLANKVYTISSYRSALEKMEIFFNKVDVTAIFHRYRNEPPDEEFQKMQAQAFKNVALAKDYLSGRLFVTAILEALCLVTGGDAPVVMIMGNNTRGNVEPKYEFNDLINQIPIKVAKDINETLLDLFEYEAHVISVLDLRKTPLAAFVYKSLGHAKLMESLGMAKKFFSNSMTADEFLQRIDREVVAAIAGVCAEMISTRRERFLSWAKAPRKKRAA